MHSLVLTRLMLLFAACGASALDHLQPPHEVKSLGTEFVFAPLLHKSMSYLVIRVIVTNPYSSEANVTIRAATSGKPEKPISFTVSANSYWEQELPTSWIPLDNSDLSGGVLLTSTLPISVYVFEGIPGRNTDVFLLLPKDQLGTEYLLSTPGCSIQERQRLRFQQAVIVATEDNTLVNVTFANRDKQMEQRSLHKLERLLLLAFDRDKGSQRTFNLPATHVWANKPVAVIAGHSCRQSRGLDEGCGHDDCEFTAEMMPPLHTLGNSYLLVPFYPENETVTYVEVTMRKDTKIVDPPPSLAVLEPRSAMKINNIESNCSSSYTRYCVQYFDVKQPTFITFSGPVMVTLFGEAIGDKAVNPPLVLLPPVTDFSAHPVAYVPPTISKDFKHYLFLMAYPNNLDGLLLDGVQIKETWRSLSQPGVNITYTYIAMNDGYHMLHNANPYKPTHFLAIAYGRALQGSYAFILSINPAGRKQDCVMNVEMGACMPVDATCRTGWQLITQEPTNPEPNCTRNEIQKSCEIKLEDCQNSTFAIPSRTSAIISVTSTAQSSINKTSTGEKTNGGKSTEVLVPVIVTLGTLFLVLLVVVLPLILYQRKKQKEVPKNMHEFRSLPVIYTTPSRGQIITVPRSSEHQVDTDNLEDRSQKSASQQVSEWALKSEANQTSEQRAEDWKWLKNLTSGFSTGMNYLFSWFGSVWMALKTGSTGMSTAKCGPT